MATIAVVEQAVEADERRGEGRQRVLRFYIKYSMYYLILDFRTDIEQLQRVKKCISYKNAI